MNMWGEPLDSTELNEFNDNYGEEKKILLKSEPQNLYNVVRDMSEKSSAYSRICLVTSLVEGRETVILEKLKEKLLIEIGTLIEKPYNIMISIIGATNSIILIEVSYIIVSSYYYIYFF